MKKPKAPVAGHYIPSKFTSKVIDEVHQSLPERNPDESDISFCNGFIAGMPCLTTTNTNEYHGMNVDEFVGMTLEADRESRSVSKAIAEIFKDMDELMEAHGFKPAGVGVVM